ncbi:MAG: hypothetical protein JRC90_05810 [Deltaproteobacteria bacterium]|nr:hypothetical protein [Deltaproteobacteria bacterium]
MPEHSETNKMKHFEEWAKGKSSLIKNASLLVATSSEPFLEFLETIKAGKRIEGYVNLPPAKEWLNLYRNHRKVYEGVTNTFRCVDDETARFIDFYEEVFSGLNTTKQFAPSERNDLANELTPEKQKELFDQTKARVKEFEDFIENDVINDEENTQEQSDDEKRRIRKLLYRPEMLFFLRVWAPCFLLYGEYPPFLLRKARQGDDDALGKLLRLDKCVIDDPKVMAIFQRRAVSKKHAKMTLITDALRNTPRVKLSIRKIKCLFAGFLSLISIALGQKLTAAEIHRLFDAVAHDMTDELVDPDLIVSPETFEKAIQRARTFWQIIPQPDKK